MAVDYEPFLGGGGGIHPIPALITIILIIIGLRSIFHVPTHTKTIEDDNDEYNYNDYEPDDY